MTCGAAAVAACHQNQNGVPKLGGWTTPMVGSAYWVRPCIVMPADNAAANSSAEICRLIIASHRQRGSLSKTGREGSGQLPG